MPKRLTHAMDEFGVRIAVLVVDFVMSVSGSHFLRRSTDPFNVRPFLLSIFAKGIAGAREVV